MALKWLSLTQRLILYKYRFGYTHFKKHQKHHSRTTVQIFYKIIITTTIPGHRFGAQVWNIRYANAT